jgi:hypothetical protein
MPEEGSRRNRKTGSCCGATKTPRHQEGWKAHRLERRKIKPSLLPRLADGIFTLDRISGKRDAMGRFEGPHGLSTLGGHLVRKPIPFSQSSFGGPSHLSRIEESSGQSRGPGGLTRPSGFPGEFVLFDSWYDSAMPTRFLFALPGKTRGSCPRSSHITRPSSSSYIRR